MCVYSAVHYTTAINAALINSFTPVVVTILSVAFLKERLTQKQWLGIIISFLGVLWTTVRGDLKKLMSLSFNKGDVIMLFAVLFWGIYTIVLKKKGKVVPLKTLFTASTMGGLVFTWPLVIYENYNTGLSWISNLTSNHYLSLLYFGIFPTILSFLFFNKAVLQIGPSRASVFSNLVVVFASVFGIAFLGEKLIIAHFLGGGLIVLGVYLTSQNKVKTESLII